MGFPEASLSALKHSNMLLSSSSSSSRRDGRRDIRYSNRLAHPKTDLPRAKISCLAMIWCHHRNVTYCLLQQIHRLVCRLLLTYITSSWLVCGGSGVAASPRRRGSAVFLGSADISRRPAYRLFEGTSSALNHHRTRWRPRGRSVLHKVSSIVRGKSNGIVPPRAAACRVF